VTDVQVTVITLFRARAEESGKADHDSAGDRSERPADAGSGMFLAHAVRALVIHPDVRRHANDYFARQQVLERLQGVGPPGGVQPQLAPLSTAIGEIYRYRLRGDGLSPTELRGIQDGFRQPKSQMNPGVADVVSFGASSSSMRSP